jgi:hypothetical protein
VNDLINEKASNIRFASYRERGNVEEDMMVHAWLNDWCSEHPEAIIVDVKYQAFSGYNGVTRYSVLVAYKQG